jgi:hypothetical protein
MMTVEQGVVGTALLSFPRPAARAAAGAGDPAPPGVVRVLGLRMAAQAALAGLALGAGRGVKAVLKAGATVDALHAASMMAVAAGMPRYRRSALISGGLATGSALLGWAGGRTAGSGS